MKQSGLYIVIEGQDSTGKTTQINKLAAAIKREIAAEKKDRRANPGHFTEVVLINEGAEVDSGLPATDQIDVILHTKSFELDPLTNVLLFTAQRRELWTKVAEPVLKRGGIVLSSRNWFSTLAYQHFGSGISRQLIEEITRDTMPDRYLHPDLAAILVLTEAERVRRITARNNRSADDALEGQKSDFQARVNRGYEQLAIDFQLPMIETSGTIDEVFKKICNELHL